MKKIMSVLFVFTFMVMGSLIASAEEQKDQFPLGYPFSSWGEIRWQDSNIEESLIGDGYVEQGVDLFKTPLDWTVTPFVGLRFTQSNDGDHYWNNKIGPWFGVKAKHPFEFFTGSWGEISLGIRGEYYRYTSGGKDRDDDFVKAVFGQWSFGGDWKDLKNPPVKPKKDQFPLGYPFSSWGEIRWQDSNIEESLIGDGYVEQGVDLFKTPLDWTVTPFVGLRFTQSNDGDHYWNNKIGPWFGVKAKHPFEFFTGSWGEISLGIRGEYYRYTSGGKDRDDDFATVLFFQWSFGGDWKNF